MYLFTRSLRLRPGATRDAVAWAAEVTELVDHGTDLHVQLWSRTFSPQLGTLTWSTQVEDLTQLEAADDKLLADEAYQACVARGAGFVEHLPDDSIATYVHGAPDPERSVEYAVVNTAICGTSGMRRGVEVGVRLAEEATRIGGVPVSFLVGNSGAFGSVAWIAGYHDLAEMQRAEQTLYADPAFLQMIDEDAAGVYADALGASNQFYYRKVM